MRTSKEILGKALDVVRQLQDWISDSGGLSVVQLVATDVTICIEIDELHLWQCGGEMEDSEDDLTFEFNRKLFLKHVQETYAPFVRTEPEQG